MAILEVKNVAGGYGEVQILWGVDLSLEVGKLTSLVGGNGVGKTTMLRTVMGLLKPWEGEVWFDGKNVSALPPYAKAEMGLVLVPEGRQLFTDMSVEENLEMGATAQTGQSPPEGESGEGLHRLPPAQGAAHPEGGHPLRRRAADAGRGPGHHGRPGGADV